MRVRSARAQWAVAIAALVALGSALPAAAQPARRSGDRAASEFADIYRRWAEAREPEQRIALGEQALALEAALASWPLAAPRRRTVAELRFGLGSAYTERARGERAANLEKAIAHLEAALGLWARDGDAASRAMAHNNLGIAYWGRIRGERADSQEKSIAHFESALAVFTRASHPQQWAQLQNNLATVYWDRIRGERAANLEAAIAHYEAALTVLRRDSDPQLWAMAQNNLGSAYRSRIRGERAANRERAIAHLAAALEVFTREAAPYQWAQAQNNLAIAYLDRSGGERADNREKAIAHFEAALGVLVRDAYPQQWAQAQHNLGIAYADRLGGDRAANRQRAAAAFEAALSVFTREAAPLDHLRTARQLGRLLLQAGEWRRAEPVHASARRAFLLLFGEGQGLSEADTRALLAVAGSLFSDAAYAALERGERELALEVSSEGRARLLAAALALQAVELAPQERRRLEELRAAIRAGQATVETARGEDRTAALDRLVALRRELLALLESSAAEARRSRSALEEARAIAAAGAVLVVPVLNELGTKLIVVAQGASSPDITVADVPELTAERLYELLRGPAAEAKLTGWLGAYLINYMEGEEQGRRWPEWIAAIDTLGGDLWRLLGARLDAALKERGIAPGARLVWLPAGALGILPLGLAQDPASKRRLADDYEIAYAPSLEVLAAARERLARPTPATLAAVINPTGDLPGTEQEGAVVASYFAPGRRTLLQRAAATPRTVLAALGGRSYWHFASHGNFSWLDARQSALVMHQGAALSVGRLLEAQGLGRPRLVVLSACETGLYDIGGNPDEFIGLPGAFAALGAAGVLGTLWPVSDAATTLLIARFYELHLGAGLEPAAALRRAQLWLRQATSAELAAYVRSAAGRGRIGRRQAAEIARELAPAALRRSRHRDLVAWSTPTRSAPADAPPAAAPVARPYAHPYFWAGFVHTGL